MLWFRLVLALRLALLATAFVLPGATLAAAQMPRLDGANWAALGAGLSGEGVYALVVGPDGLLYTGSFSSWAGGLPSSGVATWDGAVWASVGPSPGGGMRTLAFAPDGRLYAGGGFFSIGGVGRSSIAAWDGIEWGSVGGGVYWIEGTQQYAAVVNALAFGADGRLYVGGNFNRGRTGAVPMNAVGAWDGQAWSAVGGAGLARAGGGRAEVRAMAFGPDGRLYVGGEFTTADGEPVANVAAWDGTAWDDLGGGLPGTRVDDLAFGPDGRLYADATIVGGVATDLAAWDGTAWAPVGPSVPGGVTALAFSAGGKLYAGGTIDLPDGAHGVARLDGYLDGPGAGTWVGLGGGVTDSSGEEWVHALAVGPEGEVYVGGFFDRVWEAPGGASVPAENVAVWEGERVVGGEAPVAAGALSLSVRPNPSRGAATVSVTLAGASPVRVVVVDVLGRTVATVHDRPLAAGTHALAVDVSRLPAGVYAVRVAGGDAVSSARLTVVR